MSSFNDIQRQSVFEMNIVGEGAQGQYHVDKVLEASDIPKFNESQNIRNNYQRSAAITSQTTSQNWSHQMNEEGVLENNQQDFQYVVNKRGSTSLSQELPKKYISQQFQNSIQNAQVSSVFPISLQNSSQLSSSQIFNLHNFEEPISAISSLKPQLLPSPDQLGLSYNSEGASEGALDKSMSKSTSLAFHAPLTASLANNARGRMAASMIAQKNYDDLKSSQISIKSENFMSEYQKNGNGISLSVLQLPSFSAYENNNQYPKENTQFPMDNQITESRTIYVSQKDKNLLEKQMLPLYSSQNQQGAQSLLNQVSLDNKHINSSPQRVLFASFSGEVPHQESFSESQTKSSPFISSDKEGRVIAVPAPSNFQKDFKQTQFHFQNKQPDEQSSPQFANKDSKSGFHENILNQQITEEKETYQKNKSSYNQSDKEEEEEKDKNAKLSNNFQVNKYPVPSKIINQHSFNERESSPDMNTTIEQKETQSFKIEQKSKGDNFSSSNIENIISQNSSQTKEQKLPPKKNQSGIVEEGQYANIENRGEDLDADRRNKSSKSPQKINSNTQNQKQQNQAVRSQRQKNQENSSQENSDSEPQKINANLSKNKAKNSQEVVQDSNKNSKKQSQEIVPNQNSKQKKPSNQVSQEVMMQNQNSKQEQKESQENIKSNSKGAKSSQETIQASNEQNKQTSKKQSQEIVSNSNSKQSNQQSQEVFKNSDSQPRKKESQETLKSNSKQNAKQSQDNNSFDSQNKQNSKKQSEQINQNNEQQKNSKQQSKDSSQNQKQSKDINYNQESKYNSKQQSQDFKKANKQQETVDDSSDSEDQPNSKKQSQKEQSIKQSLKKEINKSQERMSDNNSKSRQNLKKGSSDGIQQYSKSPKQEEIVKRSPQSISYSSNSQQQKKESQEDTQYSSKVTGQSNKKTQGEDISNSFKGTESQKKKSHEEIQNNSSKGIKNEIKKSIDNVNSNSQDYQTIKKQSKEIVSRSKYEQSIDQSKASQEVQRTDSQGKKKQRKQSEEEEIEVSNSQALKNKGKQSQKQIQSKDFEAQQQKERQKQNDSNSSQEEIQSNDNLLESDHETLPKKENNNQKSKSSHKAQSSKSLTSKNQAASASQPSISKSIDPKIRTQQQQQNTASQEDQESEEEVQQKFEGQGEEEEAQQEQVSQNNKKSYNSNQKLSSHTSGSTVKYISKREKSEKNSLVLADESPQSLKKEQNKRDNSKTLNENNQKSDSTKKKSDYGNEKGRDLRITHSEFYGNQSQGQGEQKERHESWIQPLGTTSSLKNDEKPIDEDLQQMEENQENDDNEDRENDDNENGSEGSQTLEKVKRNKNFSPETNAAQKICNQIWKYIKIKRNKKHRAELVQFIHHCATIIQKNFRGYLERKSYIKLLQFRSSLMGVISGWKTRKILKLPKVVKLLKDIQRLQEQKSNSEVAESIEDIEESLYEQKRSYSNSIIDLSLGGKWIAYAKQALNKDQISPSKQRESEQRKNNQWDDVPIVNSSMIKKKQLNQWENAYPANAELNENQKEFIKNQKNKNFEEKKKVPKKLVNDWDEVPVGGHQKKEGEIMDEEFPTGKSVKKESVERTSSSKKPVKKGKKSKELIEGLQRRVKYDPRKAIEQAKLKEEQEMLESKNKEEEINNQEDNINKSEQAGERKGRQKKKEGEVKELPIEKSSKSTDQKQKEKLNQQKKIATSDSENKKEKEQQNLDKEEDRNVHEEHEEEEKEETKGVVEDTQSDIHEIKQDQSEEKQISESNEQRDNNQSQNEQSQEREEEEIEEIIPQSNQIQKLKEKTTKKASKEQKEDVKKQSSILKPADKEKLVMKKQTASASQKNQKKGKAEKEKEEELNEINANDNSEEEQENEEINDDGEDEDEEDSQIKNQNTKSRQQIQYEGEKKREYLKRKKAEAVFETLNWKNVKSRTDTGRQEIQEQQQSLKQNKSNSKISPAKQQNILREKQPVQIQPIKQSSLPKEKQSKTKQQPYYSELNYIEDDDVIWAQKMKKIQASSIVPFSVYTSHPRNQMALIPRKEQAAPKQQYPIAPKIFTEYHPNKTQQKAIHQLSPTQPTLDPSQRNTSRQQAQINIQNYDDNIVLNSGKRNVNQGIHEIQGSEDIPDFDEQQEEQQQQKQELPTFKYPRGGYQAVVPKNGVPNMAEMRQYQKENKLTTIQHHLQNQQYFLPDQHTPPQKNQKSQQGQNISLNQQQQQQQQVISSQLSPNKSASQLSSKRSYDSKQQQNNKRSDEQIKEIQSRQFQLQKIQHKQNFVFPQTLFNKQ